MSTTNLKRNFHDLIDSIDNERLLFSYFKLLRKRTSEREGELWNKLSSKQQEELLISYEESLDKRKLISHEDVKKKHEKWL